MATDQVLELDEVMLCTEGKIKHEGFVEMEQDIEKMVEGHLPEQ